MALFAFVNSVSLCEHGLRFLLAYVMMHCFVFVTLGAFVILVLTIVFGYGIHARAFNK